MTLDWERTFKDRTSASNSKKIGLHQTSYVVHTKENNHQSKEMTYRIEKKYLCTIHLAELISKIYKEPKQ